MKTTKDITQPQKQFCEIYVHSGYKRTQSYLDVYKDCKSKESASVCVSRLLKNVNIQAYIKEVETEIKKYLQRYAKTSELKQLKTLGKIVNDPKENTISRLKAIEIINKMLGYNEPEKHEHLGSINILNLGNGKEPE